MKQGKYRAIKGRGRYLRPKIYTVPDDYDPEQEIATGLHEIEKSERR
jgi:hypothetical protein